MEKAFPMICALSQLRVIEHIAQRQEKRAGCKKNKQTNLCKVLRRHAGQVESLDNPELQHDHTYQQRQHPPSTTHARHSSNPPKKKEKRKNQSMQNTVAPPRH